MQKLKLLEVAALYLRRIEEAGCELEYFTDFEAVPAAASEVGRNFQMPGFSIERVDHTERTAFWLFLIENGRRVGGVAAMVQDIGREKFSDYQCRVSKHHFPNAGGATIEWVAQPLAEKMAGRLAYIGELTFDEKSRGRVRRLEAFMRLVNVLAILNWDVDWVYAFIPDRHKRARLDQVYGFTQSLPNAQKWAAPEPAVRSSTEWWVGSPRKELEHVLLSDLEVGNQGAG
ncbi:hypothetical protein [Phaeobacter gallaeciensis]|uniref:hypothetical protein n=1 Tax=Phaeobacter gallaeciensis TaxID=60890 RepID=UPI00237F3317|nr:hypothetical protein [Phaeobacter gallaeciensis]MDE4189635.1 hypothetical protein [Phaeobacter gallaeciensis]MDE4198787.1 hypothetical protein [Phaeobacter gallaeciensis]MDE4202932.1 hypothetical protein [Phaeobacter gallaeciensis]MDE4207076.1 hypothetical protein [Phaeobacter gallaeciensis]MDE4215699.1 hypothetical protein [Phaeobacter gallaeciensis]